MLFMNEWDVARASDLFAKHAVIGPATITLQNLVTWTNRNSDGWAYWPKPCRAAAKLQELIQNAEREWRDVREITATADDLKRALSPIKAFRTRHKADFEIVTELPPVVETQEYLVDLTATLTARFKAESIEAARETVRTWQCMDPGLLPLTELSAHSVHIAQVDDESTDEPELFADFENALTKACRRAYMDSNDMEIERLQEAVEAACNLLGIDIAKFRTEAQAWAEEKGHI